MSDDQIREALSVEAHGAPDAGGLWARTERRLRRRRLRQGLGGVAVVAALAVLGLGGFVTFWQPEQQLAFEDDEPAGRGYAALLDAVPLNGGRLPRSQLPEPRSHLMVNDLPRTAEAGDVELPAPGAKDWLPFDGLEELVNRGWWGTPPFGHAVATIENRPFAETIGFVATDVDQAASWGPKASTAAMTLRRDAEEVATFLDDSDDWVRQGDDPRWYRGADDADQKVVDALEPYTPSELAVVVDDGVVQVGAAPGTQNDEAELPAALAPDRQEVGDLAGMDRLAGQLDGWAHNALVAPKPHLPRYFEDAAVTPVGEPLEPFRHFALAGVAHEHGERTALVLVHDDVEAARINAGRLAANLAEDGRQNAEVRRDGTVVVADSFAEQRPEQIANDRFRQLGVAVPKNVQPDETVRASMGVTVTLESVQGTELEVKPVAVHDPATPDEEANKEALPSEAEAGPGRDTRLVAVELAIFNVGNATYDGPIFGGADLLVDGEPIGASPTAHVTECNELGALTLGPGEHTSGCLVFAPPADAEVGDFEMALDAGRSDETGVWQLEPLELP